MVTRERIRYIPKQKKNNYQMNKYTRKCKWKRAKKKIEGGGEKNLRRDNEEMENEGRNE